MAASASRKVQQKYSRFREWQAGQTITRVVAFSDRPSSGDRRKIFQFTPFYPNASVITSKPAIRYHLLQNRPTGPHSGLHDVVPCRPRFRQVLLRLNVARASSRGIAQGGFQRSALKSLLRGEVRSLRRGGNRPRPGFPLGETGMGIRFLAAAGRLHSGSLFHDASWDGLMGSAATAMLVATAVAVVLVRQLRGPHLSTCP